MPRLKSKTSLPRFRKKIDEFSSKSTDLTEELLAYIDELKSIAAGKSEQQLFGKLFEKGDTEEEITQVENMIRRLMELQSHAKQEYAQYIRVLDTEIGEMESRAYSFQKLYEIGIAVTAEIDLHKIMELGMEAAIDITNARRGYLALITPEGDIEFLVAKNMDEQNTHDTAFEISLTIIQDVIRTKSPVEIEDASQTDSLRNLKSVEGFKLRSILCVPLESDGKVIGVIYLDNKEHGGIFTKESTTILQAFSKQIAHAIRKGIAFKEIQSAHDALMESLRAKYDFSTIIGKSDKLRHVLETVAKVADTSANVLIQGESGTGKELIAYALHYNSARRDKPFIVVNSAAIPETLLESELFGYEKGAFTGAVASKPGKFELAHGGTLFLDEIGEMSPTLQAKLLRAIQQRTIERVGGTKSISVDIRIISATNKELPTFIKEGKFREDLYYRLNVVSIHIPPLRERREDIALLTNHFFKKFVEREKKSITSISNTAMDILEQYDWPGNARQLENTIERAVILCSEEQIQFQHFPKEIVGDIDVESKKKNSFNDAVIDYKRTLIIKALQETGNHKTEAAKKLGLSRSYFYTLLSELGIQ